MIADTLQAIITFIIQMVNLLLLPIDLLISSFLPDTTSFFTSVGDLFSLIGGSLGWVISLSGLSSSTLSLIVLYYTIKLTSPLLFYSIKLALKWYNSLKL